MNPAWTPSPAACYQQGMFAVDRLGRIAFLAARPSFAAHSMDTDWYAVDRQGNVGKWSSGEEGAVPYAAYQQPWHELSVELAMHHAASGADPSATADPSGAADPSATSGAAVSAQRRIITLDRKARVIGVRELPGSWSGVVQFENAEYQAMFEAEYAYWVERPLDGAPFALQVRHLLTEAFDEYWSAGAIRAACVLPALVTPHALGLYEYACGFSGPYTRERVPEQRLSIHELPAPLRGKLSALQLGLDFDSTTNFDPLPRLKCLTYR